MALQGERHAGPDNSEGISLRLESPRSEAAVTAGAAAAFLKAVGSAPSTLFKAVGLGDDVQLRDDSVSGAAVVADSGLVHLCASPGRRAWRMPVTTAER